MAQVVNGDASISINQSNANIIQSMLEDYGFPAQKAVELCTAFFMYKDRLKDADTLLVNAQKLKDEFLKLEQLKKAATSVDIKSFTKIVQDQKQNISDIIDQKEYWASMVNPFTNCDVTNETQEIANINAQIEKIEKLKEAQSIQFGSMDELNTCLKEQADDILSRRDFIAAIEIGIVFKDVAFGIHKIIKTAKDLKFYQSELDRINNMYVKPTLTSFRTNGVVDRSLIDKGLFELRVIKNNVQKGMAETKSSFFGHLVNAVTMSLNAYATFTSVKGLTEIASKSVLATQQIIGTAQASLAVSSMILTGFEGYNYMVYRQLISDIDQMQNTLEQYSKIQ